MTRRFGHRAPVLTGAVMVVAMSTACAPAVAPVVTVPAAAPAVTLDQKVSWMLRLEHQRVLRGPETEPAALPPAPADPALASSRFAPAGSADLGALMADPDPLVRRRAALAIGRTGVPDGVDWLVWALADPDEEVRAMAAFGLGLLGSRDAVDPLRAALGDGSPLVRGRVIEALGLIGDRSAAPAIAETSATCGAVLAPVAPDDEDLPKSPDIEACRLALVALVRLQDYQSLARVALDDRGNPVSRWWPVAFALQRINDGRAVPALLMLASSPGVYTPAFALRGLAAAGERRAASLALALAQQAGADVRLRVAAVRALAEIGGTEAVEPLVSLVFAPGTPPNLALEAVSALGRLRDGRIFPDLVDLFTHEWPAMRLAAMTAAARVDSEGFLLVVSSLQPDRESTVRAGLASVLAELSRDRVQAALEGLADDEDPRVAGPGLEALARLQVPDLSTRLFRALAAQDFALRATAARLIGETRPEGGVPRLVEAYTRGLKDATTASRTAVLDALARYGSDEAAAAVRRALADPEWAMRRRAAELLRALGDPDAEPDRPAPLRQGEDFFSSEALLRPPFSPHAFIETRHGTIEVQLNLVEAPVTTLAFVELARAGFYNGLRAHRVVPHFVVQTGDPRGDGQGGPGYALTDELSPIPFVRGTVGMALAGPETAGSQFFITVSPQPHLDARYTVFGKVVHGHDVLDRIAQGDVIDRVRIWDGVTFR